MANSVDPNQMNSVASDLGLHCLQRPICPNARVITVCVKNFQNPLMQHKVMSWMQTTALVKLATYSKSNGDIEP